MSIKYIATSQLPTPWGVFAMHGFEDTETGKEHVALTFGELNADDAILGRIHSECLTGDALFSLRCDCGFQLQTAMQNIAELGQGFILYLSLNLFPSNVILTCGALPNADSLNDTLLPVCS